MVSKTAVIIALIGLHQPRPTHSLSCQVRSQTAGTVEFNLSTPEAAVEIGHQWHKLELKKILQTQRIPTSWVYIFEDAQGLEVAFDSSAEVGRIRVGDESPAPIENCVHAEDSPQR